MADLGSPVDLSPMPSTPGSSSTPRSHDSLIPNAFSRLRRTPTLASQLVNISAPSPTDDLCTVPKIRLGSHDYILKEWLSRKRTRRSWISDHGTWLVRFAEGHCRGEFWCYTRCDSRGTPTVFTAIAISSAVKHLKSVHYISKPSGVDNNEPAPKRTNVLQLQQSAVYRRPPVLRAASKAFHNNLLGWIVDANVPISMVEHNRFCYFLKGMNLRLTNECLPKAGTTIRRWLEDEFIKRREVVKA